MSRHLPTEVRKPIVAANAEFMAAFGRADTAALADSYTEEGQVLPPNSDVVAGKEAIQAFWKGAMDQGVKGLQLETIEAEGHADTAYEVGRYTLLGAESQVLDTGKYVVIWKQVSGQWKLHRDIFNSSRPEAGQ